MYCGISFTIRKTIMNSTTKVTDAADGSEHDDSRFEQSEDAVQSDQSFVKDDSDIQIISVDSPNNQHKTVEDPASGPSSIAGGTEKAISETGGSSLDSNKQTESGRGDVSKDVLSKSSSSAELVEADGKTTEECTSKETFVDSRKENSSLSSASTSKATQPSINDTKLPILNGASPNNKKLTNSSDSDTHLNQAAIKLLQKLEFKNPGRKQIEYGLFNPEESEREKKKLRRFQATKPRAGVCYKENGLLLDGRDVCDCLAEACPGCFYPCPNCSSKKCGPTCRCNRKWVYDYIEDEGRTYRVEFPEQMNF